MKPRAFAEQRPGVLTIRGRYGLLRAFGVVPLLFSGIALYQGIGGRNADLMPPPMALVLGLVFGSIGLVLLFGETEIVIDRTAGRVRKTARLFFLRTRESRGLDEFRGLRISWEYSRSDDSQPHSYRVYVLALEPDPGASGADGFEIARSSAYEQVRSGSEKIGRFLNLPVHDDSQKALGG